MTHDNSGMTGRILRHVTSKQYRPQKLRKLARSIGVGEAEYGDFRAAVKQLMRAGRVVLGGGNMLISSANTGTIIGSFRGHARGFGFVVPDSPTEHGDLFIPPGATLNAITGDTVVARITRRKGGEGLRVEGEIIEIIKRGQSRFVGELVRQGNQYLMLPDGHALQQPVVLGDVSATRARPGDQVVVELTEFPHDDRPSRGVIVEVLGRRGDPGVDTLSIIRQYGFPDKFPEDVLEDARRAIRMFDPEAALSEREDLRDELIVTIDPDDAKNFDDAISLRRKGRGYELGVHIADVSAFVQPGRPLDIEARKRGNSIYLPRHVIPMLPEQLSNGICSLQEGQPRLTKSVFIEYDARGHRKATRFANTVIQSRKRLTYGQATDILEGRTKGFEPEVVELIREMERLAKIIRKRRLASGMIVLELPEVELVMNDDNEVIDVEPADTSFSHTLIEMFMVEANEAVAELMTRLHVPHLRRIHPEPPEDAQAKLTALLRVIGKAPPKDLDRRALIKLLDSVRGKPEAFPVHFAVLRSMSQAEYSPKMEGHYALASEHYSHFTSPIRRYPDLVLHRLLDMYLQGRLRTRKDRASIPSEEALLEIGRHCSYTERRAEDAERELKLLKILRLLEGKVGEIFNGVVTGVTNLGLFVQLEKYLVEGLIRFDDLEDDWWDVNARGGYVVGQRSGKRIAIGHKLSVQIAAVNLATRELDLTLAGVEPRSERRTRGGQETEPLSPDLPERMFRGSRNNHRGGRSTRRGGPSRSTGRSASGGRTAGGSHGRTGGTGRGGRGRPGRGGGRGGSGANRGKRGRRRR